MKLAVLYDSRTGNTKQAAEWIAEGMASVEGAEARACREAAGRKERRTAERKRT